MDNKFSNRLDLLIKEKGIKKNVIAEVIGLKPQSITEMTKGRSNPSPQTLKSLARYLCVNEEWLEYGTGEKESHYEVRSIYIPQPQKKEYSSIEDSILNLTDKLSIEGKSEALKAVMSIFISEQTKGK